MDVWEAIRDKRAVRNFNADPLQEDTVQRILDAGRRAQSSKNTQPWHFIAVRERELLERLAQTGDYLTHVTGAALCVVMVMPADDARGWKMFDLGQSASYMQLVAHELGVGSCIGSIHRPDAARDLLGFPDDLVAYALISFGYPHSDWQRTAHIGGRRPLDEVIHWERW